MTEQELRNAALPKVTFLTEQHVGLKTYSENLKRFVDLDERIEATWAPVTYGEVDRWWERLSFLPGGITGSLRGRVEVRSAIRETGPDACFFMTQTPAALGGKLARGVPYVIMVDDTPILFDGMSEHYQSPPDRLWALRWFKHRANTAALRAAHAVVPMSKWAQRSLLTDYGMDPARATVIPTGLDLASWTPGQPSGEGPMKILFVGGDFERKGGNVLLQAFDELPAGSTELHLVTRDRPAERSGVFVHNGMEPNAPELIELYRRCDVFVLPSKAEAFPNAVVEACASGLVCVISDVGGMSEMIVDGESGFVVDPHDVTNLADTLQQLLDDPERRTRMGEAARRRAEEVFDGATNARRVVDLLLASIGQPA